MIVTRFCLCTLLFASVAFANDGKRSQAQRLRTPNAAVEENSETHLIRRAQDASLADLHHLVDDQNQGDVVVGVTDNEKDAFDALLETLNSLNETDMFVMSMPLSYMPSDVPSAAPSSVLGPNSTMPPSAAPSVASSNASDTNSPVASPVTPPSAGPVMAPTTVPTTCTGLTEEERILAILAELDAVADPEKIRDNSTPQGLATTWIIYDDELKICPGGDGQCSEIVQRWTMAVAYFSAGGGNWTSCSGNPAASDDCGNEEPFIGKERWLSASSECVWAGVACINGCVTEIEFEDNNIAGTIATEMGLLQELQVWGMERGGLVGTIPTEVGKLSKLIFLDLDFNALTGTLTPELLSLSSLTQLDLNNNKLSGSINGIGVFPFLEFLQIHSNDFTGTVPESVGLSSNLAVFTLHDSFISGTMPASVCDLVVSAGMGGVLTSLIADCSNPAPDIICTCCTDCRSNVISP